MAQSTYLELHGRGPGQATFWRAALAARSKTINLSYGNLSGKGLQTFAKDLPDVAKAKAAYTKQVAAKMKKGYTVATDPQSKKKKKGAKRKAPAAAAAGGRARAQRPRTTAAVAAVPAAVPAAAAPPPSGSAGVIVEKSGLRGKGTIYNDGQDLYDIDIAFTAGNSNKFYKMQIIKMTAQKDGFSLIQNWGPIGKVGQVKVTKYDAVAGAVAEMEKIFKKKTGLAFSERNTAAGVGGKYAVMQQRRSDAGGKEGKLTISLMWDNAHGVTNDLDLWVMITPASGPQVKLYYGNKNACGGVLDVDRFQDCPDPVENVFWEKAPPKGTYEVIVHNYSQSQDTDVTFTVSITKNGETEMFEKKMPANKGGESSKVTVKTLKF